MKATKVNPGHSTFKVPECFQGGTCLYCGTERRDYDSFRIGKDVYCNFDHYVRQKEKEHA